MASYGNQNALERNLRKCYDIDICWDLVPKKLHDVSMFVIYRTVLNIWLCFKSTVLLIYCKLINVSFFVTALCILGKNDEAAKDDRLSFYLVARIIHVGSRLAARKRWLG